MIRLIMRGIAAVLIELATITLIIALVALGLSAYITSRFVGVNPRFSHRTMLILKYARDALAYGISAKRQQTTVVEDTVSE